MFKTDGQRAYEGYYKYSNGLSLISGAKLPTWDAQDERIKAAWEAAAEAIHSPRIINKEGKEE